MNNEKILIEIASYHDPELFNTINSAIIQADNPERVYFAVCYQGDDEVEYNKLKEINNCKIKWLKEHETKGLCYARDLCQKLIDDEKYIYQIDSHMRFVKHWDTKMIEELLSLNDARAIISFYPPDCNEEMLKLPLDDKSFDNPNCGGLMYFNGFRDATTPFVNIYCDTIDKNNPRAHTKSAIISGNNFFSFSDVHKEVFQDTKMYFYADELFMSLNIYTHGWNIYNSGQSYIYHHYNRKNAKFSKVNNAIEREKDRFLELLNHKDDKKYLDEYKIGNKRTITEYEKFSGIDFENRIIYMNAETGEFENEKYIGKLSYFTKKEMEKEKIFSKQNDIEVLIVDLFGDYKNCITNCLDKAIYKDCVSFIVGSIDKTIPSEKECSNYKIKKYISFNKNSSYCKILNSISKYINNNYVAVIDSSVRFLNGWDKYLCDNLKLCGNKSALTSWIWETDDNTIKDFKPYVNITQKIREYYYNMPVLEYDSSIDLSNINNPYQTAFMFNGFIFCHSKIIKEIEFDPNLNYEEHKYLYALRLWTNGVNLYLPKLSYMLKNKEEKLLNTSDSNLNVVCSLTGINNSYSRTFEADYNYDIGSERPLWTWYNYINIDYDIDNKKII